MGSARDVVVVVQKGDHSLGYYDFHTGEELARVPVDPFPHEFAISPDGRLAYLANFGVALAEQDGPGGNTLSIVDLRAQQRIATFDCGPYRRPHDVAFDGRGGLYVLSEGTNTLLVVPDAGSGRIAHTIPTRGHGSHMVSVLQDGSVAFCSNMESGTVTAVFPQEPDRAGVVLRVGARTEGSVLDQEERRLFVMNRESHEISIVDVHGLCVLGCFCTPPGPVRACRDGGRLLVALYHGCGLLIVDMNDTSKQRVVSLPAKAISVGYHPPSHTALLSCLDQRVYLVDTDAGSVLRSITTRSDPDPVAVLSLAL